MIENILKDYILSACYGELDRFNKYSESYTFKSEEQATDQWTYIVEMMVITAKSLIPSIEKSGAIVDYQRFSEELKLWVYYRHGENNTLINTIRIKYDESYWFDSDDSVYSRIVPIVVANEEWPVILAEVIKNILYTSGNIQILLECIILSKLLYVLFNKLTQTNDETVATLKEEIIGLSQKDLLSEYKDAFRISIEKYSGNYSIDFERNRIDMINLLNGISNKNKYNILATSLNIINGNAQSNVSENFFIDGLKALWLITEEEKNIKDREFILSLCSYLIKLRKGRIAVDSLKIEEYNTPTDIFKYNKGDVFVHPLLNKCKVISRKDSNGMTLLNLNSKSGMYRFMKKNKS